MVDFSSPIFDSCNEIFKEFDSFNRARSSRLKENPYSKQGFDSFIPQKVHTMVVKDKTLYALTLQETKLSRKRNLTLIKVYTSLVKAQFWMDFGNKYFNDDEFDFYRVYPIEAGS